MTIKVNDHEDKQQIEHLEERQQVDELAIDDWDLEFATLSEEEIEKLMKPEHKPIN